MAKERGSPEKNMGMKPAATETCRQRLLQLQERLVRRIYELDEELLHVTDRVIEYGEKAQAESPEEVLARLDDQSRREWEAIQAALQRIEAGTYGAATYAAKPYARHDLPPCQWQLDVSSVKRRSKQHERTRRGHNTGTAFSCSLCHNGGTCHQRVSRYPMA